MAKLLFILSSLLVLQISIEAATNAEFKPDDTKIEQDARVEEPGPTLDSKLRGLSEDTDSNDGISPQGQRQKRFYNYFNFGYTPYGPINPSYVKRDNAADTGVYGTEDLLSLILKRVQEILSFTRQQALSPAPASHIPVPSYTPVFYIPHISCACTPDNNNQGPTNNGEPNGEVPSTPHTATTTTPPTNNAPTNPPEKDNVPVKRPSNDTNNMPPEFITRFVDMDSEDGTRPISFEPIQPNIPLSRPPPPVEHGTIQAGENTYKDPVPKQDALSTTTSPSFIQGVPAQAELPTNSIPTLCDGAVLTCCHRSEVTYDCFLSQGCPNPMPSNNPCDVNVIRNVIQKFQYYYANRKTVNKLL